MVFFFIFTLFEFVHQFSCFCFNYKMGDSLTLAFYKVSNNSNNIIHYFLFKLEKSMLNDNKTFKM
jgi:hypothetical protein